MKRIITQKRLRQYATAFPSARPSLLHWEKTVLAAAWLTPTDLKASFNDVDAIKVGSGHTVYVFNIQRNEHRLVASVHFNTGLVFVLRLMTHREYDRTSWKEEL